MRVEIAGNDWHVMHMDFFVERVAVIGEDVEPVTDLEKMLAGFDYVARGVILAAMSDNNSDFHFYYTCKTLTLQVIFLHKQINYINLSELFKLIRMIGSNWIKVNKIRLD